MTPFDTKGPLNFLVSLVNGLAVTQEAHKGIPVSLTTNVAAVVAIGPQRGPNMKTTGVLEREISYLVRFAARSKGKEDEAEDALADFLDQFQAAFYADVTLGGTVRDATLDLTLVGSPEYQPWVGQEHREYPLAVNAKQQRAR